MAYGLGGVVVTRRADRMMKTRVNRISVRDWIATPRRTLKTEQASMRARRMVCEREYVFLSGSGRAFAPRAFRLDDADGRTVSKARKKREGNR
jgi:hypothetical protein